MAVPVFPQKTFRMVSDPSCQNAVSWNEDGRSFTLHNLTEFAGSVLPRFFSHRNITSFLRQLNMYSFHKEGKDFPPNTFSHPAFIRGREDLLPLIERKKRRAPSGKTDSSNYEDNIGDIRAEVDELRSMVNEQSSMLYTQHETNQSLWKKIKELEWTTKVSQCTADTVIQYLKYRLDGNNDADAIKRLMENGGAPLLSRANGQRRGDPVFELLEPEPEAAPGDAHFIPGTEDEDFESPSPASSVTMSSNVMGPPIPPHNGIPGLGPTSLDPNFGHGAYSPGPGLPDLDVSGGLEDIPPLTGLYSLYQRGLVSPRSTMNVMIPNNGVSSNGQQLQHPQQTMQSFNGMTPTPSPVGATPSLDDISLSHASREQLLNMMKDEVADVTEPPSKRFRLEETGGGRGDQARLRRKDNESFISLTRGVLNQIMREMGKQGVDVLDQDGQLDPRLIDAISKNSSQLGGMACMEESEAPLSTLLAIIGWLRASSSAKKESPPGAPTPIPAVAADTIRNV